MIAAGVIADAVANFFKVTILGYGLRFYGLTSGSVGLVPSANAGSTDYTLPNVAPAVNGQSLVSTTTGVMSFAGPHATQATVNANASLAIAMAVAL